MKKLLILVSIFIMIFLTNKNDEDISIPNEAIRLRILANSNSIYDQNIKMKVKDEVENNLSRILKNTNDINSARLKIINNLDNMHNNINSLLTNLNYDHNFKINYGMNYFPEKKYKGVICDAGEYESLLVTLGNGAGDNWWCVLFPPLCVIEAEESEIDETEYKFFIKEIIDKIF